MTLHPDIAVTRAGASAIITIDRPAQRNALTLAMWRALGETILAQGASRDVRTIIVTGAGGQFSAGADIREFARVRQSAADAEAYEVAVDACCDALATVPQPSIAAVEGFCLGGACHLAMSADFRIAAETAVFAIPAARMSIVYGIRPSQKLLALVGLSQAKRILYLAERIGADEAHRIGLVDQLAADPLSTARDWAEAISGNAPLAIAGAKTILNGLAMGTGALDADRAAQLIREAADSADFAEGRRAFEEKRPPRFSGR